MSPKFYTRIERAQNVAFEKNIYASMALKLKSRSLEIRILSRYSSANFKWRLIALDI